jgi:hypothetical protein
MAIKPSVIKQSILSLLAERKPEVSICPSEVARALFVGEGEGWRELMPEVLASAAKLAESGRIRITRGEVQLDPRELGGGPIRLRRGEKF